MSKFLKVMIVLLTIAAMAVPAFASDLSISGTGEVRGYFVQTDDGTNTTDAAYNDQRFRTAIKYTVAEGVSVNFRFDVTESPENSSGRAAWGSAGQYTQRRADIQYDKAYLELKKGGYTFQAGELYVGGFGTGMLADVLGTGFVVKRDAATVYHIKQGDSSGEGPTATGTNEKSLTGASYAIKNDSMSLLPMVAYQTEGRTGLSIFGLGLEAAANLGAINLKGEIDFFSGDATATTDAKGLQLYVDASTAVSDTVTVGGIVQYAQGQDGTDVQIQRMGGTGFGGWSPTTYGFHTTDFNTGASDYIFAQAGVIAAHIYGDVKVSDALDLKGSFFYAIPEDDTVAGIMDETIIGVNASAKYKLMTNTSLTAGVLYQNADLADVTTFEAITGLYVNF